VIHIALIDDHPMLTATLGEWLSATGRFSIVGTAATLEEARSLMKRLEPLPEIVVLDVSLSPSGEAEDGLTLIPELKKICAERGVALPGIVVFTMHEDLFLIQRAMDLGAKAYIAKSAETGEFITAVDEILAGNTYINPKYKLFAVQQKRHGLTRRENEIAALVKQSLSARQIAERLGLSIRTVETHLAHIYIKTDTASWEELRKL
jgi:NarL family two-component system response regulator LiaR